MITSPYVVVLAIVMYVCDVVGLGIGVPSSLSPLMCNWIAFLMFALASSGVAPVAAQPGKSGT